MKILLLTTLYPGYENQSRKETSYAIHYFVKEWVSQGHDVTVAKIWPQYPWIFNIFSKKAKEANKFNKDAFFELDNVGVNRLVINKIPKIEYRNKDIEILTRKVIDLLSNRSKPDIILCHMFNPSLFVAKKIKIYLDVPLVLAIHKTDIKHLREDRKKLSLFTEHYGSIDYLAFRSNSLKKQFDLLNLPSKKNFMAMSGIDEKVICNENELETKINRSSRVIFVAATLVKLKNIDSLIKAFEKVALDSKLELRIAGDGPEMFRLKEIAKQNKVKDQIVFLGYLDREEVLKEMLNADIFAMVSSPETFGLVYLEAMAKGCITIGSKGEGIDGVIQDGINGFLCEPGNQEELQKKLLIALDLKKDQKKELLLNSFVTTKNMTQKKKSIEYIENLNIIKS